METTCIQCHCQNETSLQLRNYPTHKKRTVQDRRIPDERSSTHFQNTIYKYRHNTNQRCSSPKSERNGHLHTKTIGKLERTKLKLLGHILRADHSDPLRQALFESGTNMPRYHIIRRSGRPKLDWLLETMKDALLVLGQASPRDIDHTHVHIVATAAQQRIRPF